MALLIFIFFFFSFPLSCNAGQDLSTDTITNAAVEKMSNVRDTITNAAVEKMSNVRDTITNSAVEKFTQVATDYPRLKNTAQKLHHATNVVVDLASQTSVGQRIAESSVAQTISRNIPTETINQILYHNASSNEEPLHRNGLSSDTKENGTSSEEHSEKNESSEGKSNHSDSTKKIEVFDHQNKQESYGKVSFSVENVPPDTRIPANVFTNYPVAVMKAIKKINKEATNVEDILPKEPHYMDFQLNGLTTDRITVRISWKAEQREAGHQILKRCRFILTEMRKEYASKGYRMLKIDAEDGVIIIT